MNYTVTSSQELHTSSSGPENELDEVLGLPAVDFYAIHYTALVVLSCSGTVSCGVLISLVACSKTRFRERPIGERLVVYLASCDLIFRWGMFTKYVHIQSHGYKFSVAWMAVVYPHGTYFVTLFHNAIQWSILRASQAETWWCHQMETFSALLMFSLICARINGSVNNREASDLRRHRGHYDGNVMKAVKTINTQHIGECSVIRCDFIDPLIQNTHM